MIHTLPIPGGEYIFEDLTCDLWKEILKNRSVQRVGRRGQGQDGVDIIGRDKGGRWIGVQCKWKSEGKQLSKNEINKEIEKAKGFSPPLSEYHVFTTAQKDAKIEKYAREITEEHKKEGLFSVNIWGWEDIKLEIQTHPEVLEKYYPGFGINIKAIRQSLEDIKVGISDGNIKASESHERVEYNLDLIAKQIPVSLDDKILDDEFQEEINYARELINISLKPKEAYDYLDKLRERIWGKASNISKFRMLTNMGAAKIYLDELQAGAYLFIKALSYNDKEEKALSNAAFAYFLLEDFKGCKKNLEKTFEKNPFNMNAHSIKIDLLLSESVPLEQIIKEIPDHLKNKKEINIPIAQEWLKQENFTNALDWIERIENKNDHIVKDIKGSVIIGQVKAKLSDQQVDNLDDADKKRITEAIGYLKESLEIYKDSDLKKSKTQSLVNIGFAHSILGKHSEALDYLKIAYNEDPDNPAIIKNLAIEYWISAKSKNAIELFEKLIDKPEHYDICFFISSAYADLHEYSKSEKYLKKLLNIDQIGHQLKNDSILLLTKIYLSQGKLMEAKRITENFQISNILELIIYAKIYEEEDEPVRAIERLLFAKDEIKKNQSNFFRTIIAQELYFLRAYREAIELYEEFANKDVNSNFTRQLIHSYFEIGIYDRALEISEHLRQKYGPIEMVTEIEAIILEDIGDLEKAIEITKDFLRSFPGHINNTIRLCSLYLRIHQIELARNVYDQIKHKIKIEELDHQKIIYIAHILQKTAGKKQSLDLIYAGLRKLPQEPSLQMRFISMMLFIERENKKIFEIDRVTIDSAVSIKDDSGNLFRRIIESSLPDINKNEISPDHLFAKKLMGKKTDDKIILNESGLQDQYGTIVDIKHKYVFKFNEIMENFERNFPSYHGIKKIKVDLDSPEIKKDTKGFDVMFRLLDEKKDYSDTFRNMYKKRILTIGCFAQETGTNPVELFWGLINDFSMQIKCCYGNAYERQEAFRMFEKKPDLIMDITSIILVSKLGIWDIIYNTFGKPLITRSSLDLFYIALEENEISLSKEALSVWKNGDNYVQHRPYDDIKNFIEFLDLTISYIKTYCQVIPCKKALHIPKPERDFFEKIFNKSFYETVLIAQETENSILFSEDYIFRNIMKREYKINGVWTQVFLMYIKEKKIISEEKYSDLITALLNFKFHYTSIDSEILYNTAEKAKWEIKPPFTLALDSLNGYNSTEGSISVAVDFIFRMWNDSQISVLRLNHFTKLVIDELMKGRNRREILKKIEYLLKRKFQFSPHVNEIEGVLRTYETCVI